MKTFQRIILILVFTSSMAIGQTVPKNVEFSVTPQSGVQGVTLSLDSGRLFVPNGGKVIIRSDTVILSAAALDYITKPLRDQVARQAKELKLIAADMKRLRIMLEKKKKTTP